MRRLAAGDALDGKMFLAFAIERGRVVPLYTDSAALGAKAKLDFLFPKGRSAPKLLCSISFPTAALA